MMRCRAIWQIVARISGAAGDDFWRRPGRYLAGRHVLRDAAGPIADLAAARALPGAHNAQNAAAAAALALALGVARPLSRRHRDLSGTGASPGARGRGGGVLFINDSKATNADSAARALGCYDRIVWIAGGMAKAGGIEAWLRFFPRIALALLIGRDAPVLAATLAAHGVPFREVGTLEAAVAQGWQAARRQRGVGGAAIAGLRILGPVHRLRPARRPFPGAGAGDCARDAESADAAAVTRRYLAAGPLVVDGGPLDAAGGRHADRARLRDDAGGEPGGRRAHQPVA